MKRSMLPHLVAALALAATSCGRAPTAGSTPDTVHIDQTPVKNQGGIGFCWSYSLMGMVESNALRNGQTFDLSEEYLGFYRILLGLREALAAENPQAAIASLSDGYKVKEATDLAEQVGFVPESAFTKKFPGTMDFGSQLKRTFITAFSNPAKLEAYKKDENALRADLESFYGMKVPRPTDTFTWNGKSHTPLSFGKDVLKFRADDYVTLRLAAGDTQAHEIGFHYLKVALMNRISVPVGMNVLARVEGGVWDASSCQGIGCDSQDGHAMLVVDFITQGGRGGEMPEADALRLFHEPLEGVIVKNSWGLSTGLNQDGNPTSTAQSGFNLIRKNYLDQSISQSPMTITLPKFVIEQETGIVAAGLKVAIGNPEAMGVAGETQTFKAMLLSVDKGMNASAVQMNWTIKSQAGQVVTSGSGRNFTTALPAAGVYSLTLTASSSNKTATAQVPLWVGASRDFRMLTGAIATNNFATYSWDAVTKHSTYAFDTRNGQPVADANEASITLPAVQLKTGGRAELTFNFSNNENMIPSLQVSTNNGSTFEEMPCLMADPSDVNSPRRRCTFPTNGRGAPTAQRLQFRLVTQAMPQAQYKVNILQEITELSARIAGGDVEALSTPLYVTAEYPAGAAYKNVVTLGSLSEISALFPTTIDSVRIYRGSSLLNEIPSQQLKKVTFNGVEKLLAVVPAQVTMPSSVLYRLVAVVDDMDSSSVSYEVLAVPQLSFTAAAPFVADLRQGIPFAFDSNWFATPLGLSASSYSDADRMVRLINNDVSATAAFGLDLSRVHGSRMDLQMHHNLEQDYDFFYVRVSTDNGKSWQTAASRTGMSVQGAPGSQPAWNTVAVDLSAYDGKNILVRLDAETDAGMKSNWLMMRALRLSARN